MEHTLDQFGKEKITPHPTRTAAIVLAAGQGKRMKSKIQKQFLLLEEKPVIWYHADRYCGEERYCAHRLHHALSRAGYGGHQLCGDIR